MNVLKATVLFSFVGISSAFAQQNSVCQDRVERGGSIQLQMRPSSGGDCFLSVRNYKTSGMVYRDYLFSASGNFLVFNSFGDGSISDSTGAREFYIFPRRHAIPQYKWNTETRRLEVTSASGSVFYFDYENSDVVAISNGNVKVASTVTPANRGGVEISNYKGLILDVGFTMGKAPSENQSAMSTFTDENGKTCKVRNGEVFKVTSTGDVNPRYTDKGLAAFLKNRCPQLKFTP